VAHPTKTNEKHETVVEGQHEPDSSASTTVVDPAVFWRALPFILEHPGVAHDQQFVCTLMAASSSLQEAVTVSLKGMMKVTIKAR
jgi:hypothetical protein